MAIPHPSLPQTTGSPAVDGAVPEVLAGPILRRVQPELVVVWVALSTDAGVTAEVVALDGDGDGDGDAGRAVLGVATSTAVRLGERLWVHRADVRPAVGAFPGDVLLGYDVVLRDPDGGAPPRRLADLGLTTGPDAITYGDLPLPSFAVRRDAPVLRALHGSCRLLHGTGDDGLSAADDHLREVARQAHLRPCALFLTGDQVYGDDVAGPLVGPLRALADTVAGAGDARSVPGLPDLSTVGVYGRMGLAHEQAAFTSPNAQNHLFSFGEYAAMYLLAWNPDVWPAAFPTAAEALPDAGPAQRRQWRHDRKGLERTRPAMGAVRRVLANTPTYMVFDDHDVTDDWNITARWRDRVRASPTGRRTVANALAAFWAFQGWGNDPDLPDDDLRATIAAHLAGGGDADAFDEALWDHDDWSYVVPTSPPAVVLDTRTQRSYDSPEGAARLIDDDGRRRLAAICQRAGHRRGEPLVLVSPVPMFGLEIAERRQKALVQRLGPYRIDFEQWHSNLAGLMDLQAFLAEDLALPWCVVLSGDVHYGITIRARFAVGDHRVEVAQLVSSSLQHGGAASKWALDAVGSMVSARHDRVGWRTPPAVEGGRRRAVKRLSRPADTDSWGDDSPVLMAPRRARRMGITQPPDVRESRRYVRPEQHRGSVVVGDDNVGLVTLEGTTVRHELLTHHGDHTRRHGATVHLA